jgi:hypothetical protein
MVNVLNIKYFLSLDMAARLAANKGQAVRRIAMHR